MGIPADPRAAAIYHTILSDLHRMRATLLNLKAVESGDMEQALREHFSREQTLVLGRLTEWRQRRPEVFHEAESDFAGQVGK